MPTILSEYKENSQIIFIRQSEELLQLFKNMFIEEGTRLKVPDCILEPA